MPTSNWPHTHTAHIAPQYYVCFLYAYVVLGNFCLQAVQFRHIKIYTEVLSRRKFYANSGSGKIVLWPSVFLKLNIKI